MRLVSWHYLILVAIAVAMATLGTFVWLSWDEPLRSATGADSSFRFFREVPAKQTGKAKVIYGFLPYWNLNKAIIQPELSHVGYFGLGIMADGSVQLQADGSETPGYTGLKSEKFLDIAKALEASSGRLELVFTQFYGDDIARFLNNPKAQNKFIATLDTIIMSYPIAGVNIDIEPTGIPITPKVRQQYVTFISNLRNHLNEKYSSVPLSIDLYASASDNDQIWDLPALAPHVDYVVVMAYDYHRRSSPQAGPVAPVFGGEQQWDGDISKHLRDFLQYLPAEKILLGVPFYGYEWQTTDASEQAKTYPETGATATIKRVNEILANRNKFKVKEHWNEAALSPYLSYVEDGKNYIVYYENPRSVSYKLDLVNQLGLGGMAIWAIGYEGEDRVLWDVIKQKLQ